MIDNSVDLKLLKIREFYDRQSLYKNSWNVI